MKLLNRNLLNRLAHANWVGALTLTLSTGNVNASIFSKFISEAANGVVHTTPSIASKLLRTQIQNSNKEDIKVEQDLYVQLSLIDESTGKMGNSIVNLIYGYNTPEQKIISKSEYERIRSEFKKRVSGEKLAHVKLLFLINFKCMDYANVVMSALHENMTSGKSPKEFESNFEELKKCSVFLNKVKGYSSESANSFSVMTEKIKPIFKEQEKIKKEDQVMLTNLVGLTLHSGKTIQEQVKKASAEWF